MNGTVISARISLCPGNEQRYKTYAPGKPSRIAIIADIAACQMVNQIIFRVSELVMKWSHGPVKPCSIILNSGK
jgi:hypothetical protein